MFASFFYVGILIICSQTPPIPLPPQPLPHFKFFSIIHSGVIALSFLFLCVGKTWENPATKKNLSNRKRQKKIQHLIEGKWNISKWHKKKSRDIYFHLLSGLLIFVFCEHTILELKADLECCVSVCWAIEWAKTSDFHMVWYKLLLR